MHAFRFGHLAIAAALALAASSAGCTTLGMKGLGGMLGEDDQPAAIDPSSSYQVVFVPTDGKPQQLQRTLSGSVHVQEALDQVGAAKKFRRIEVELVRPLPNGGHHRILCEYDVATKQVTPEFDYALLPGDRLIVKEDPSNMFDDMLSSALGPMGTKFSKRARRPGAKDSKYQIQR
ncbi:MAG TPA: hypothetical protein VMP01_16540 [Pirellulaceae bacterium]|nr:hypothetical protein [Pirellulaceae bacterium]